MKKDPPDVFFSWIVLKSSDQHQNNTTFYIVYKHTRTVDIYIYTICMSYGYE